MKCYTIGYGGRKPEELLLNLKMHGIQTIVDVRLHPERASMGIYKMAKDHNKGIQGLLQQNGIDYIWLVELGNIFLGDTNWETRYRELLNRDGDSMVSRLKEVEPPFCLLCAEKNVDRCHRRLIADFLESKGFEWLHL